MSEAASQERWNNVGEESSVLCVASVGVTAEGDVFPVRCKKWSCPVCAPINALLCAIKTANGVQALFAEGLRPKFVTITQPGSVKTAQFAYSILHSQWEGFRHRWQYKARKAGEPNAYAAFVEGQSRRQGMPHFHIIGTALPSKEELRDMVVASGLGFQVDLQIIEPNSGIAWYVSKYSTKGSEAHMMPKGFRRVRYSQDWPDMLFRADLQESNAVVRQRHESYAHWLIRAVQAYQVDPKDIMEQTQALLDLSGNEQAAERAARTLIMVNAW